jgi:hypothetical protein
VKRSSRPVFIVTLCWIICFVILDAKAQTSGPQARDTRVLQERIDTIFRATLQQGETEINYEGQRIKVSTFIPPSTSHVEEIKSYGDAAIPILEQHFNTGSGFEKYLALRFLGLMGGSRVVEPLGKIALGDPSPSFREVALLWLSVAPWDLAAPILRQAAENDVSFKVRDRAAQLLAQHEY